MSSDVEYFQDTNGNKWNGQVEYGDKQKATCIVDVNADSAILTLDISVTPTGCGCVAMTGAYITTSKGSFLLGETGGGGKAACGVELVSYCHGPDGKDDPVTSVQQTYDITNYINFNADKTVDLIINGCHACSPSSSLTNTEWHMNDALITYDIPADKSYGNVTVSVTAEGSPVVDVPVHLTNQSTGQGYSVTTNSQGVASGGNFDNIPVGSYDLEVGYGTFEGVTKTVSVQAGDNNYVVALACPKNTTYCQGNCYPNCGTGTQMNLQTCQCESSTTSGLINPIIGLVGAIAVAGIGIGVVTTVHKAVPSGNVRLKYEGIRRQLPPGPTIEGNAQYPAIRRPGVGTAIRQGYEHLRERLHR